MSIVSVLQDTKARLDSLLSFANETTGQSDASIGDAIRTLTDGYGGGGGGDNIVFGEWNVEYGVGYANLPFTHNLNSNKYILYHWMEQADIDALPTNTTLYFTSGIWTYGMNKSNGTKTVAMSVFTRIRKSDNYLDTVGSASLPNTLTNENQFAFPQATSLPAGTKIKYVAIDLTGGSGGGELPTTRGV